MRPKHSLNHNIKSVPLVLTGNSNYMPVGYRDTKRPPISVWELKAALRRLEEEDVSQPNEDMIFEGVSRMRAMQADAIKTTKEARRARRTVQQRKSWQAAATPTAAISMPQGIDTTPNAEVYPGVDVPPFAEIVESK